MRFAPPLPRNVGRLIDCPGCGHRVGIVEISLGGTGAGMRPDLCGDCQPLARTIEPAVDVTASPTLSLVERPDPRRDMIGRYYTGGRETELEAAHAVAPRAGSQRAAVLERLRDLGPAGATDYELWRDAGIGARPHVAGTRREELTADGWPIVDSGERRPTDTGTPAIVWRLDE